jgi:prepilin-type N-terminal cleavage/methylation domain-containing protein
MRDEGSGFTLIELIISMAVYAILLIIMSTTVVAFSRLYQRVNSEETLHYQTFRIQEIISTYYQDANGTIEINAEEFSVDSLKTGTSSLLYENNALLLDGRKVAGHATIESIDIDIVGNRTIISILDADENPILTFSLFNAGGNS